MSRRDGAFIKTERIKRIAKEIAKQAPKNVEIEKVLMWIEANIGLSPKRSLEYLNLACASQGWIILLGEGLIRFE